MAIQAIQACYKVSTHCFSKFMPIQETSMVQTNTHYAHHIIFHSTYKHSFSHQSISHGTKEYSFSNHNMLCCTHKTFILHTIACFITHMKHIYCTLNHIALHTQNIHTAHQFIRLNQALRDVICAYGFILSFLSIHMRHIARAV